MRFHIDNRQGSKGGRDDVGFRGDVAMFNCDFRQVVRLYRLTKCIYQ